ncbi:MAG: prolyl oligopeptidase family serine peptidase [Sedimentisphaerales bacterium]|nr:prolyl oligopeptidase family serine peptidase [Sedimentisphaerales bacterium]
MNINNITNNRVIICISTSLCAFAWNIGFTLAQTSVTEETKSVVLNKGLTIDGIGQYGRSSVYQDVLAEQIILGSWSEPQTGDTMKSADGTERTWKEIEADENGWFSGGRSRTGYIYVRVDSDAERIMLLKMFGNSMAYVNGVPRVGSRYQYKDKSESWEPDFSYVQLPILLKKGHNDLLFQRTWRSRGRMKITLSQPGADIFMNATDLTLPDVLVGRSLDTYGAIVVVNATTRVQKDLSLKVTCPDQRPSTIGVPIIQPLSVRKVPFPIKHNGKTNPETSRLMIELKLLSKTGRNNILLDHQDVLLDVRTPSEPHKRTFISRIDGSVQYYAVNPATPLPSDVSPPALVLSVHGAGVLALNQARSYHSKSWCNIVSPTNRRPYGFDWEDWGRIDALEALDDAKTKLGYHPERVYLTGHSMGGHGTWILGSLYPDKFGAIGPCAGWLSFWSYRGATKAENPSAIDRMLMRAESAGDTAVLAKNLAATGIYILHGANDNVVSPEQSQMMIEQLNTFHKDFVYHEEPGQGHWWDISDEHGSDCVDWAPMFDFFARHALPPDEAVRQIDFLTVNPGISAWSHWVGIEDQIEHLTLSSVSIRVDPGRRRFVGTTDNVARLSLKLDILPGPEAINVKLDDQTLTDIPYPTKDKQIWLTRTNDQWAVSDKAVPSLKGPHRFGPFKTAFDHRMVFVFGTQGNEVENAWSRTKARFDAEQWWYQGNGSVDIIADVDFNPAEYADRGVILYGNATTNAAWNQLLTDSPVQVSSQGVTIDGRRVTGDSLACLFLRPRPDSDVACVAAISGTDIKGMRLTDRLQYLFAGCNYPDCIVFGPEMLRKGPEGVRVAGVFGSDWSVKSGSFAWADQKTEEPNELPAYIGPDPRPFVMPRHYVCQRVIGPMTVDGKLNEPSWEKAPWTEYHLDIEGQMRLVKPRFNTRCKMLWDDRYFYVAAMLEDPHVWGTITERNTVIFHDNDFEAFIDPDGDSHSYYEFEVNALNTVWNLYMDKPYKHGGNAVNREMPGQKSGVYVKGTLNDPGDTDEYWTVEIAFPWKAMAEYAHCACPPEDGDQWRVNFSRVQWSHKIVDGKYVRVPSKEERTDDLHEDNWIWSPQGVVNMHRPETWGYVQFSAKTVGTPVEFQTDPTARLKYLLHKVLYAQEEYHLKNKRYAKTLKELGFDESTHTALTEAIVLRADNGNWEAKGQVTLPDGKTKTVFIRQDGKVWTE